MIGTFASATAIKSSHDKTRTSAATRPRGRDGIGKQVFARRSGCQVFFGNRAGRVRAVRAPRSSFACPVVVLCLAVVLGGCRADSQNSADAAPERGDSYV